MMRGRGIVVALLSTAALVVQSVPALAAGAGQAQPISHRDVLVMYEGSSLPPEVTVLALTRKGNLDTSATGAVYVWRQGASAPYTTLALQSGTGTFNVQETGRVGVSTSTAIVPTQYIPVVQQVLSSPPGSTISAAPAPPVVVSSSAGGTGEKTVEDGFNTASGLVLLPRDYTAVVNGLAYATHDVVSVTSVQDLGAVVTDRGLVFAKLLQTQFVPVQTELQMAKFGDRAATIDDLGGYIYEGLSWLGTAARVFNAVGIFASAAFSVYDVAHQIQLALHGGAGAVFSRANASSLGSTVLSVGGTALLGLSLLVGDGLAAVLDAAALGTGLLSVSPGITNWIGRGIDWLFSGGAGNDTFFNLEVNSAVVYAPDIYLYPTRTEHVDVVLGGHRVITSSRPAYRGGWDVTASPDGALSTGGHFLYYEAQVTAPWQTNRGWVIPAAAWPRWIRAELPHLGLNTTEMNDFAIYWDGRLPRSAYYLIAPQPQNLVDAAVPLEVTPTPDSELRLWLYVEPLARVETVKPPAPMSWSHRGFSVVEWGVLLGGQQPLR